MLVVYGIHATYEDPKRHGFIFILFGSAVALGALFSWAYLPDPQRRVVGSDNESDFDGSGGDQGTGKKILVQKTLEDLGGGREKARLEGEVISVKDKWRDMKERRRRRRRKKTKTGSQVEGEQSMEMTDS